MKRAQLSIKASGQRHIALLRGINVGGRHRLPMAQLVAYFEAAGARAVVTYIQSGNVVFVAPPRAAGGITRNVEAAIAAACGFKAPIQWRAAAEFCAATDAHAFDTPGDDPAALHMAFLAARPGAGAVAALHPKRGALDRFEIRGREIHLHLPSGVARTKLTTAWFDTHLGTTSTVRNWRTVQALRALAVD